MGSETLHERLEDLTAYTRDMHRAIVSLMEELEAIDWYQQRIDATPDAELRAVLAHNRDEEIEHAMMNLEWLRRNNPTFASAASTYLFTSGPITALEEKEEAAGAARAEGEPDDGERRRDAARREDSLGIGSLKLV